MSNRIKKFFAIILVVLLFVLPAMLVIWYMTGSIMTALSVTGAAIVTLSIIFAFLGAVLWVIEKLLFFIGGEV